jgi:hypothetical protein
MDASNGADGAQAVEIRPTMPRPSPEASAKEIAGILEARSAEAGHVDLITDVKASFLRLGGDETAFADGLEFGVKKGWFNLSGFAITLVSGDTRTT